MERVKKSFVVGGYWNANFGDDLFLKVKQELISLINQSMEKGEQATDLLMVAKYFERIGDHATNIAEWVIYSITGSHDIA